MMTKLWGLRDKTTHEPIYTYWASSNKYRALFAKKETAENACRNPRNPNMEPFCITGDPIRAAGGCRCGECRKKNTQDCPLVMVRFDIFRNHEKTLEQNAVPEDFGCTAGEPREVQDDG